MSQVKLVPVSNSFFKQTRFNDKEPAKATLRECYALLYGHTARTCEQRLRVICQWAFNWPRLLLRCREMEETKKAKKRNKMEEMKKAKERETAKKAEKKAKASERQRLRMEMLRMKKQEAIWKADKKKWEAHKEKWEAQWKKWEQKEAAKSHHHEPAPGAVAKSATTSRSRFA